LKKQEEFEEVLVERVGPKTRNKEYKEYLVKWKDKDLEDASQVPKEEPSQLVEPYYFEKNANHIS
jgi:hypothetical protein